MCWFPHEGTGGRVYGFYLSNPIIIRMRNYTGKFIAGGTELILLRCINT